MGSIHHAYFPHPPGTEPPEPCHAFCHWNGLNQKDDLHWEASVYHTSLPSPAMPKGSWLKIFEGKADFSAGFEELAHFCWRKNIKCFGTRNACRRLWWALLAVFCRLGAPVRVESAWGQADRPISVRMRSLLCSWGESQPLAIRGTADTHIPIDNRPSELLRWSELKTF